MGAMIILGLWSHVACLSEKSIWDLESDVYLKQAYLFSKQALPRLNKYILCSGPVEAFHNLAPPAGSGYNSTASGEQEKRAVSSTMVAWWSLLCLLYRGACYNGNESNIEKSV